MAVIDLSLIQTFLPILSFLLVFTVVYAVLAKYKILGESKFVNLFVSFIIATIFVSLTSAREYVISITPWFAVFILAGIFLLALAGFAGKISESLSKSVGIGVVIGLLIVFLISAYYTFSSAPFVISFGDWVSAPRVYGPILLIILGALVSWILVKAK